MKMKKLLKNAVVYAVAASMLFATPLTASAGLIEVYHVEDGSGHIVGGDENDGVIGTVTNTVTDTNTTVLTENSAKIIGISLDQEYVNAVKDEPAKLNATVVFDGSVSAQDRETANKFIRWEVVHDEVNNVGLNKVNIDVSAADRTVATLNPTEGTELGKEVVIRASIGNPVGAEGYNEDIDYDITFEDENGKKHVIEGFDTYYYAEAKIYVKEYSESLSFNPVATTQYVKHTLDLGKELNRTPATANDEITWSTSDAKIATVSAAGVVTFKKATAENQTVTITAVGEKGGKAKDEVVFTVGAGKKADKVEIYETAPHAAHANDPLTKDEVDLGNNERKVTLKAVMLAKDSDKVLQTAEYWKEHEDPITDEITWTSSKSSIVEVEGNGVGNTVTLTPKAVGKATITAKASNGAKATYTLTVTATLNELKIKVGDKVYNDKDTINEVPYSGQTLQLDVWKNPSENTGKVKWAIEKVNNKANPNATINAKGVVTFKATVDPTVSVTVKATCDNKEATVEINVKQSSVTQIAVRDGATLVAGIDVDQKDFKAAKADNTDKLSASKSKTYTVTTNPDDQVNTLTWKTSSAKVATVEPSSDGKTVTVKALAKGNATITVSGINVNSSGKAKTIKTTFKVSVTQPVTSLTMNKTSVVLKATNKTQNVSLSVKANKNAKASVTWSVRPAKDSNKGTAVVSNPTKGKVTLEKDGYFAGDEFVVTATDATGVRATATIKVVSTSTEVTIWNNDPKKGTTGATFSYINEKNGKTVSNATVLGLGESVTLTPMVNVGEKYNAKKVTATDWVEPGKNGNLEANQEKVAAGVTYTVNKKGIVTIIGNEVHRVKAGSVTITVKTEDGKSYKLKIDDVDKGHVVEESVEPEQPAE